tara:strand:+ start:512 stop:1705 length:1194 start_codon:yes stop_codon:yes gene_type:complete
MTDPHTSIESFLEPVPLNNRDASIQVVFDGEKCTPDTGLMVGGEDPDERPFLVEILGDNKFEIMEGLDSMSQFNDQPSDGAFYERAYREVINAIPPLISQYNIQNETDHEKFIINFLMIKGYLAIEIHPEPDDFDNECIGFVINKNSVAFFAQDFGLDDNEYNDVADISRRDASNLYSAFKDIFYPATKTNLEETEDPGIKISIASYFWDSDPSRIIIAPTYPKGPGIFHGIEMKAESDSRGMIRAELFNGRVNFYNGNGALITTNLANTSDDFSDADDFLQLLGNFNAVRTDLIKTHNRHRNRRDQKPEFTIHLNAPYVRVAINGMGEGYKTGASHLALTDLNIAQNGLVTNGNTENPFEFTFTRERGKNLYQTAAKIFNINGGLSEVSATNSSPS